MRLRRLREGVLRQGDFEQVSDGPIWEVAKRDLPRRMPVTDFQLAAGFARRAEGT